MEATLEGADGVCRRRVTASGGAAALPPSLEAVPPLLSSLSSLSRVSWNCALALATEAGTGFFFLAGGLLMGDGLGDFVIFIFSFFLMLLLLLRSSLESLLLLEELLLESDCEWSVDRARLREAGIEDEDEEDVVAAAAAAVLESGFLAERRRACFACNSTF